MRVKIIKYSLLLFLPLLIGSGYFFWPEVLNAESSDAIAVRIVENPEHYSTLRWYQSQNFTGSPQSLQIDGYDAIRDNQTAYVNVANIVGGGSGGDSSSASLYTNIFIISYAQDTQGQTSDIFGQLIKNLKFNTNLSQTGNCSLSADKECLTASDCAAGEYCNSQKAKVIRDVKRLSDLQEIRLKLEDYKQKNNYYPKLNSGTYLSNRSVSTWPSWQNTLASELGSILPIDPLNKLGDCPNFNPTTCWDENKKIFATNLDSSVFPSGSHIYFYHGNEQGTLAKYCTQMETRYVNIRPLNCFDDKQNNRPPSIGAVNLIGQPKKAFNGYVSISDPDGNPLSLSIDLVEPSPSNWLTKKWRWVSGLDKFQVLPTNMSGQKKIYAPVTGEMATPGYYKVRLTVNDGQEASNSIYSSIYDLIINPLIPFLEKGAHTSVIGRSESVSIRGEDINGNPITNLAFKSAFYEDTPLTAAELDERGLWLREMGLLERFTPLQRTGVYTVNVSSVNAGNAIDSSFSYVITNNPPVLDKLVYYFGNGTSQTCSLPEKCSVAIDNGERAIVRVVGQDIDGHSMTYSLIANPDDALAIDQSSGTISGFEKLNWKSLSERTFTVSVKMSDEYCANSKENECSSIYSFNVVVKKYCSSSMPESMLKAEVPQRMFINKSGDIMNTGLNLSDCSEIGSSTADIKFIGESRNQAIVFVNDVSGSMGTNVTVNGQSLPAIERLKPALAANNTGFFDRVYQIVRYWPSEFFVKIGVIAYSHTIMDAQPPLNLVLPGSLDNLKNRVRNYSPQTGTHTLMGLNKAEEFLASLGDPNLEKIVILMSDGIPGIDGYEARDGGCFTPSPPDEPSCWCGGEYPDCVPPVQCGSDEWNNTCTTCIKFKCQCGGEWGSCNEPETCGPGEAQGGCTVDDCYIPPHSSYNNFLSIRRFISRLFNIKSAKAITPQTQCLLNYNLNCDSIFGAKCSSADLHFCYNNTVYNCDITSDVDKQAQALKASGASLYTIYYNTSSTTAPQQRMCNWSSNNGADCNNNTYAFAGTNIDSMITSVLQRIVSKPKDVKINGYSVIDSQATQMNSEGNVEIKGLNCGEIKPIVTFTNSGFLELSNLKLDYCPAKLHP